MAQVTADPVLLDWLTGFREPVQVLNEAGQVVGFYQPAALAPPGWAKANTPHTREELEGRRQDQTGKPLADILKRLEEQHGGGPG